MKKASRFLAGFTFALLLAFTVFTTPAQAVGEEERTASNPIITSIFTADPSAHVWPSHPNRLFLYPSQDIFPAQGCDLMDRYHVFSTDNMVDWVNHGEILRRTDLDTEVWGEMYPNSYFMWAPDAAYSLNHPEGHGPYFFFFPVNVGQAGGSWTNNWKIGVAHSDCPVSGFRDNDIIMLRDVHGSPIHGTGVYIDPSIFWDPDCTADGNNGNHYLVVGGSAVMRIARLQPCLSRLAEEWHVFDRGHGAGQIPYFHEGPWMFSRVNDFGQKIYYVMYAADNEAWPGQRPNEVTPHGGALAYVSSAYGPYGPWTFGSAILQPGVTTDTSHGSIVEFPLGSGEWYLFYHTDVLSMGQNNLRSSAVDQLFFNPDGSIQPVVRTETSVPAVGPPTCQATLDATFGAGNWSMEIPFRDMVQGGDDDFDGFVLHHVYSVMLDSVIAGGGAVKNPGNQIIQNLHIAGAYIEFTLVDGGNGGTALLQLNYGRDGTGGLARVTVNGEHVHAMRIAPSNGWYDFSAAAFLVVELAPGAVNTIRIDSFAFNVRSLSVHHRAVDVAVPPQQQVANAAAALTWERIRLANTAANNVTTDLHLPIRLVEAGEYDVTVQWESSQPNIVSTGGAVSRPHDADADVTLTATLSLGGYSQTVTFNITVAYEAIDPGSPDLLRLIPGSSLGDAHHNRQGYYMVWEDGNHVVGWIRPWAWIRFDNVDLQGGIDSFTVRYARAAASFPAHFQLWKAPVGSPPVPGVNAVNLPDNAVMVGEIQWGTAVTDGWGIPGSVITTEDILNGGSGHMDLYAVFVEGEINFAYVALLLAEETNEPAPANVIITPAAAEVTQGESRQFAAAVYDENSNILADAAVTWHVLDENGNAVPGASINENGLLTVAIYVPEGTALVVTAASATVYGTAAVSVTAFIWADFTALQGLVNQALLLDPEDFTPASWALLAAALGEAEAVLADAEAPQAQIDAARDALQAAINTLVEAPFDEVNTALLQALIAYAITLDGEDFTPASWAQLAAALREAEAVLADAEASQAQVDAARHGLQAAINALDRVAVDEINTAALQAALVQAQTLDPEDFTPASWAQLAAALGEAEAVLADAEAPQAQIDAARDALQAAIDALVAVDEPTIPTIPIRPQPPITPPVPPAPPPPAPFVPSAPETPVESSSLPLLPLVIRQRQQAPPAGGATDDVYYDEYEDAYEDAYNPDYESGAVGEVPAEAENFEDEAGTQAPSPPTVLPAPLPPQVVNRLIFTVGDARYSLNNRFYTAVGSPFIDPATNRMMVPLHTIAEATDTVVEWYDNTRSVIIYLPTGVLMLPIYEPLPDGMGMPMMIDGRVFVPLRFVMDVLGKTVTWDSENRTGIIAW